MRATGGRDYSVAVSERHNKTFPTHHAASREENGDEELRKRYNVKKCKNAVIARKWNVRREQENTENCNDQMHSYPTL